MIVFYFFVIYLIILFSVLDIFMYLAYFFTFLYFFLLFKFFMGINYFYALQYQRGYRSNNFNSLLLQYCVEIDYKFLSFEVTNENYLFLFFTSLLRLLPFSLRRYMYKIFPLSPYLSYIITYNRELMDQFRCSFLTSSTIMKGRMQ